MQACANCERTSSKTRTPFAGWAGFVFSGAFSGSAGRRLHLDPDAVHSQALGPQPGLEGGQQLSNFGGGCVIFNNQTPIAPLDGACLYRWM